MSELKNEILLKCLKNRKNKKLLVSTIEKIVNNCEEENNNFMINSTFKLEEIVELAKLIDNNTTTTKKHDPIAFLDSITLHEAYAHNLNWIHKSNDGYMYASNGFILAKIKDDSNRSEGLHRKNGAFMQFGDRFENNSIDFDILTSHSEFKPFNFDPSTCKTFIQNKDVMYDMTPEYSLNAKLYSKLLAYINEKTDTVKHFININTNMMKIEVYTDSFLKYEGVIMLAKKEVN